MNGRDREPSTSPSLLQSAKEGRSESWRKLAQIYGPVIYGWARRCGCQAADAADVMQETLASMTTARRSVRLRTSQRKHPTMTLQVLDEGHFDITPLPFRQVFARIRDHRAEFNDQPAASG